ncbi:Flagellar hook-length control protein FliK [Minicystis rosea]|nr:Flagellar hook-length control protein FliK [Minicystis rosea]
MTRLLGQGGHETSNEAEVAARGLRGAGQPLPHIDAIRRAFGHHDVSDVQAYVGGEAARASSQLGAKAYAMGNQIAFKRSPDLRTAAHEAAHVVQQRTGLVAGGGGGASDPHEQHADRVAQQVVEGRSAAALLDEKAAPPGRRRSAAAVSAVQLLTDDEASELEKYADQRRSFLDVSATDQQVQAKLLELSSCADGELQNAKKELEEWLKKRPPNPAKKPKSKPKPKPGATNNNNNSIGANNNNNVTTTPVNIGAHTGSGGATQKKGRFIKLGADALGFMSTKSGNEINAEAHQKQTAHAQAVAKQKAEEEAKATHFMQGSFATTFLTKSEKIQVTDMGERKDETDDGAVLCTAEGQPLTIFRGVRLQESSKITVSIFEIHVHGSGTSANSWNIRPDGSKKDEQKVVFGPDHPVAKALKSWVRRED